MSMDAIFNHYLPLFVLLCMSSFMTWLKFVRLHSSKYRFVQKTVWFRLMLMLNLLFSLILFFYLRSTEFSVIPGTESVHLALNHIILAILSPFIVNGTASHFLEKGSKQDGLNAVQGAYAWINKTIEEEVEKVINQKTIEIAEKMEDNKVDIIRLERIAKHFIYQKKWGTIGLRNSEFARLDDLVKEKEKEKGVAGLIAFLIADYCDPEWLAEQTKPEETES